MSRTVVCAENQGSDALIDKGQILEGLKDVEIELLDAHHPEAFDIASHYFFEQLLLLG